MCIVDYERLLGVPVLILLSDVLGFDRCKIPFANQISENKLFLHNQFLSQWLLYIMDFYCHRCQWLAVVIQQHPECFKISSATFCFVH